MNLIGTLLYLLLWILITLLWFIGLKKMPVIKDWKERKLTSLKPLVSIIIPARNEANSIEKTINSIMSLDYKDIKVILVNDRSTDHTLEIMHKLIKIHNQRNIKLVNIEELPAGWIGKNYACYLGSQEATGEWLLFTDADIIFSPSCLSKAMEFVEEKKLDHFTLIPGFIYGTLMQRPYIAFTLLVLPLFVFFKYPLGIGAFNLLRKSVYTTIGTHEAIALRPDDDIKLGKLVVKRGYQQMIGFGRGELEVKWYDNMRAMIKGFEKINFPMMDYRISNIVIGFLLSLIIHIFPYLAVIHLRNYLLIGYILIFGLITAIYTYFSKMIDCKPYYVLLHPILALIFIYSGLNSTFKILFSKKIEWRDTNYELKDLMKNQI